MHKSIAAQCGDRTPNRYGLHDIRVNELYSERKSFSAAQVYLSAPFHASTERQASESEVACVMEADVRRGT